MHHIQQFSNRKEIYKQKISFKNFLERKICVFCPKREASLIFHHRELVKNVKKTDFYSFFIIERWFFKGIHRKNKKVKTVFASILIPKCAVSKPKIQNISKHRIQFIMKIMIFRKTPLTSGSRNFPNFQSYRISKYTGHIYSSRALHFWY